MRTVASPIRFATGVISRSNSSRSASSTVSGRFASRSPSVSVGSCSRTVASCPWWWCMLRPFLSLSRGCRFGNVFLVLGDLLGDELGVFLDPSNQGGAAGVLPRKPEKVEPGDVRHTAAVTETAVLIEDRKVDPGVVGAVPRGPEDCVNLQLASVLEARGASARVDDASFQCNAVTAPELAGTRADQGVACTQAAADPRLDRRVEEA